MTQPTPRKFAFDTTFDPPVDGAPAPQPVWRSYSSVEVEKIRAASFAEGQRAAAASAEARTADAVAEIARHCTAALGALARVAHDHRESSAALALAAGRKIADAALDRFPDAPIAAAMIELAREIEAAPMLKVQVAPDLVERAQSVLEAAAQASGFAGAIQVGGESSLPRAAFVLEWGEGRASFDPEAASERVAAALNAALAAEGLHAEPLISTQEADNG